MVRLMVSSLALVLSFTAYASDERECYSAKEFITTLNYLRDKKDLGMTEPDAQKIAKTVALQCSGAAQRFIETVEILVKTGVSGKDSVEQGVDLAKSEEARARMYIAVFREAFAEEGYDLDLGSSIKLARRLTFEYDGDLEIARNDFSSLSRFCIDRKGLDLGKADCAELAAKFTLLANKIKAPVFPLFERGFDFLKSKQGPNLHTANTLKLLEDLLSTDRYAIENFQVGYRYAVAQKGLALPQDKALVFAKELAVRK